MESLDVYYVPLRSLFWADLSRRRASRVDFCYMKIILELWESVLEVNFLSDFWPLTVEFEHLGFDILPL